MKIECIKLENINLEGITLTDELYKREEEDKELADALLSYLYDPIESNREHLLEETCDNIQVLLSVLKMLEIDIPEIADYWNTKHLEKIKERPRKED